MGAVSILIGLLVYWGASLSCQIYEENQGWRLWKKVTGRPSEGRPSGIVGRGFRWLKDTYLRRPRQRLIWKKLPDVFNLLALGLSTGQNFEQSFSLMVELLPAGCLRDEFSFTLEMLRLGRSREDIFLELKRRLRHESANGVIALILQSLQRGTPLQNLLFEQADALRREQMRQLERRAQTVGVRLLFPIMVFIFPCVFMLLFGALYLAYKTRGSLF